MFALGFDFAHSDGDLRRAQISNGDTRQHGFANRFALLKQKVVTAVSAPTGVQNQVGQPGWLS
jgi:hypothetical protein